MLNSKLQNDFYLVQGIEGFPAPPLRITSLRCGLGGGARLPDCAFPRAYPAALPPPRVVLVLRPSLTWSCWLACCSPPPPPPPLCPLPCPYACFAPFRACVALSALLTGPPSPCVRALLVVLFCLRAFRFYPRSSLIVVLVLLSSVGPSFGPVQLLLQW